MRTQVFEASTAFGLATVVAAIDDGQFGGAERRVLVLSNNAAVPEAAFAITDVSGTAALLQRFDDVRSYNAVVAPQHPSDWSPRPEDLPLWQRHFRSAWDLGDAPIHLVVESIQVNPASALCHVFTDATIDVYADGLMSYGPTRNPLPSQVGARIERVLHLDLVPGLRPLLLAEWEATTELIDMQAFRQVIKEMTTAETSSRPAPDAVLLGQYLASGGLLSPAEEEHLHRLMVRAAAQAGARRIVFKPHPSTSWVDVTPLEDEAAASGAHVEVWEAPELVETWFERGGVDLVVGCFSTGLMTAASCYGIGVLQVGAEVMLERLAPYENSNRIPVTLVNALIPDASRLGASPVTLDAGAGASVQSLVATVGYVMQPELHRARRADAARFLAEHFTERRAYFKRRRLTKLELPGSLPPASGVQRLRSRGRRLRNRVRHLTRGEPSEPATRSSDV